MKRLLAAVVLISQLSFGQEPTLPLKNGMVYYSFSDTLENSKRCLSDYFSVVNMNELTRRIDAKSSELTSEINTYHKRYKLTFVPGLIPNPSCMDSSILGNIAVILPVPNRGDGLFGKKKLRSNSVEAKVELVFHDKNSYTLTIKGFTYKYTRASRYQAYKGEEQLHEFYADYLSDPKRFNRLLLGNLDLLLNGVNTILQETLTEMYQTDELD